MKKAKRILVSVTNDLFTDQRVDKVCRFLSENGYEPVLIGRLRKNSPTLQPRPYQIKRMKLLFDKGPLFYAEFNFRLFLFLLTHRTSALLANDLDTLLANYLVSKLKRKCELYYDSHEYFTEVPELLNRQKVRRIWLSIEKWIFPKLKNVYTVNQSIAGIYNAKYKKEVKVVRNISPLWTTENLLKKPKSGIPENKFCLILQGAGINIDRGAEELIEAMTLLSDEFVLLIVGDGDVIPSLKKLVPEKGLQDKVLFFGKKPYREMMNYTSHADLGFTLDKNTNPNYAFSLPNKLFDYIHTETPVIATNLVEIRKIIDEYEVGIVLENLSPENLAFQIKQLKDDPERLSILKENCRKASLILNWENECKVLREIYLND